MRNLVGRIWLPFVAVLSALSVGACGSRETRYAMGDWISMGPFTFTVERATDRLTMASTSRPAMRIVTVAIRVDPDRSEAAKVKFDDFMNDMLDHRMIVHPAAKLVDADGHEFDALVNRVSGTTRWKLDFELVNVIRGLESATSFRDLRASDFHLRIRNLDRRSGQPAVAVVELE